METLDFSVENAVGWIRLTRPEIHNPLDVPLRTDLMTVLEQVRNDPAVRVLVHNGGAGAFWGLLVFSAISDGTKS